MTTRQLNRPSPGRHPDRSGRPDFTPRVRQRPAPSPKRTWLTMVTTTARTTLLTPPSGYQILIARIWVKVEVSETAEKVLELYFGTGAGASADSAKIIDMFVVKATGEYTTRTYNPSTLDTTRAPFSMRDEVVSYRWNAAPTNAHRIFIEYVHERCNHPLEMLR